MFATAVRRESDPYQLAPIVSRITLAITHTPKMKPEDDDSSVRSSPTNMHNSLIPNDMNGDADDLSDDCDSDTGMDENDLLAVACQDEITAQLAAAGE